MPPDSKWQNDRENRFILISSRDKVVRMPDEKIGAVQDAKPSDPDIRPAKGQPNTSLPIFTLTSPNSNTPNFVASLGPYSLVSSGRRVDGKAVIVG